MKFLRLSIGLRRMKKREKLLGQRNIECHIATTQNFGGQIKIVDHVQKRVKDRNSSKSVVSRQT